MSLGNISAGDPVILDSAKDLGKHGLRRHMKGFANSVTHIGNESYVHFMPDGIREIFVITLDRVVLDEERLAELQNMGAEDDEVSD